MMHRFTKIYQAPWGKSLNVVSLLLVILAVAALVGTSFLPAGIPGWSQHLTRWVLPVIVLSCLLFMVLGYEITDDAILIRRPLWKTRLDRAGLKSAEVGPKVMNRCLRTCGNGGGFSFTGWYWSKSLGPFSAYVTDLDRTVALRFDKRTVVVSPDTPEDFVKNLDF
ncbi:MAG: PH domain-containing protein [Verrucomicrobiota bacterium]